MACRADQRAQSERTDLYTDHAQRLLKSGHAYRCFCTSERLNELAKQRNQLGQSSDYDRTCAGMSKEESDERASKGEAYVIRLKAPASPPDYFDLVYGTVGKLKSKTAPKHRGEPTYDDCILIKSDGLPTYHLANVVDDHYMEITHVIRASEWMTSTPKHLVMYKAFGWEPPKFAHVGLLQDGERQKFSKRNADLDLRTLKNDGILPEALINYVVLHGWSHNLGNDFISLQELVQNFDLKFTKGNTIVQPTKLNYLQQRYASKHISEGGMTYESIVDRVYAVAKEKLQLKGKNQDLRNRIAEFMKTVPESYTTAREFYERHIALFEPIERPKYVPSKASNDPNLLWDTTSISLLNQEVLDQLELGNLSWNPKEIRQKIVNNSISFTGIKRIIRDFDEKTPNMSPEEHMNHFIEGPDGGDSEWKRSFSNAALHYLRWAIVGGKSGPGVADCMVLLGRDETALRIEEAARILNLPELQESPSDEEAMRIAGFLELEGPPSDKQ